MNEVTELLVKAYNSISKLDIRATDDNIDNSLNAKRSIIQAIAKIKELDKPAE